MEEENISSRVQLELGLNSSSSYFQGTHNVRVRKTGSWCCVGHAWEIRGHLGTVLFLALGHRERLCRKKNGTQVEIIFPCLWAFCGVLGRSDDAYSWFRCGCSCHLVSRWLLERC